MQELQKFVMKKTKSLCLGMKKPEIFVNDDENKINPQNLIPTPEELKNKKPNISQNSLLNLIEKRKKNISPNNVIDLPKSELNNKEEEKSRHYEENTKKVFFKNNISIKHNFFWIK